MDLNSILLIVDVQEGFVTTKTTRQIIPKINQLITKFGKEKAIASRFINPHSSLWESLMDWHKLKTSPEIDLYHELDSKGLRVFDKNTYSAWSRELQKLCEKRQIKTVFICGIDTDQCVLATAADIFSAGIKPVIVEDCCASSESQKFHNAAVLLLERLIGKNQIITSDNLL